MRSNSGGGAVRRAKVIIANGEKGGVAKSLLSIVLCHITQPPLVVVDFDVSNHDVYDACDFVDDGDKYKLDISKEAAWDTLADIIEGSPGHTVIVNLPAQSDAAFQTNGVPLLTAGIDADFFTIWALGPFRDSTKQLQKYLQLGTGEPVHVARAMFQVDDESDFEYFNNTLHSLDLRGGLVFDHIRAAFRTRALIFEGDEATDRRYSIKSILDNGPKITAQRTRRYVDAMRPALEKVLG